MDALLLTWRLVLASGGSADVNWSGWTVTENRSGGFGRKLYQPAGCAHLATRRTPQSRFGIDMGNDRDIWGARSPTWPGATAGFTVRVPVQNNHQFVVFRWGSDCLNSDRGWPFLYLTGKAGPYGSVSE